jgi:type II secretory pathway component PulF
LRSGTSVSESLRVTAGVTNNELYKATYFTIAEQVTKGQTISKNIPSDPLLFPEILAHLIAVGELSGSLTETLFYLAKHYENEVDESTKNLSSAIEPILLITMGLFVGLIAVSVVTPIYDITKNLQR